MLAPIFNKQATEAMSPWAAEVAMTGQPSKSREDGDAPWEAIQVAVERSSSAQRGLLGKGETEWSHADSKASAKSACPCEAQSRLVCDRRREMARSHCS